jgi:alpha-amylase
VKKYLIPLLLGLSLLLGACVVATPAPTVTPTETPTPVAVPVSPVSGMPQGTDGYAWWNDTTFYEIFVRSFNDSNGDGIGDFNGITQKLDYLQSLGVTGLWLMPINPSPSYHGYDVTDYYSVNPDYGTMEDFTNLLDQAHARGIRIIIDFVLNHTSNQNPWFQGSWDPSSPYHDWYIWSPTNPGYNGPWGEQVWYPSHGEYYYAIFSGSMPDLNYRTSAVTTEMEKVTRFWLNVGLDGFRLDAARHLIEDGQAQANTPETHDWYKQFRTFYKTINPQAVTVAELAGEDAGVMASYTSGDELDLSFDFGLASAFVSSAKSGNAGTANGQIKLSYKLIPPLQFAPFLTNHDQNRLMDQLGNDPDKVKVAASMLLTAPGVPFIYYGEEVGSEGSKPDEQIRRPMQWSADANAGFSKVTPWELPGPDWQTNNVAVETSDQNSILNHYQTLIQIRNEHAALRVGDLNVITTRSSGLYSILRVSHGEAVLVLINLTSAPVTQYSLSLDKSALTPGTYSLLPILGDNPGADLTTASTGGFSQYIPVTQVSAYGTLVFQLHMK